MTMTDELLDTIESFCEASGLTESSLGKLALSDTSFVSDLRAGRAPTTRTIEKVKKFIRNYSK